MPNSINSKTARIVAGSLVFLALLAGVLSVPAYLIWRLGSLDYTTATATLIAVLALLASAWLVNRGILVGLRARSEARFRLHRSAVYSAVLASFDDLFVANSLSCLG